MQKQGRPVALSPGLHPHQLLWSADGNDRSRGTYVVGFPVLSARSFFGGKATCRDVVSSLSLAHFAEHCKH